VKGAVIGVGTMGPGIAATLSRGGLDMVLYDVSAEQLRKAEADMPSLQKVLDEIKVAASSGKISYESDLARAVREADFVIEAVPERLELKQRVFAELDDLTPGHAILASNTSSLSISEMGDATSRPEQVVGFHFFYPASMMRLIEVIEGDDTSPETMQATSNFAQAIRKMPIRCGEVPGFVGNRIANSAISEIWRVQEEEGLTTEEVDKLVQESGALPMGPFFLTDMLGLDTVLKVAQHLRDSYGDRFYVHKGMEELVAAGNLGQKTGKGFYEHGS